ncbi:MAG: hypothetical protein AB8G15_05750 [Saprospiraceae bacterium]
MCFENPNNPYELVGKEHNLGSDAIAPTPDFENLSNEEAHNVAVQSMENNTGMELELDYETVASIYENIDQEQPLVMSTQGLHEDNVVSDNAYEKLLQLEEMMATSENAEDLGNAILEFENTVLEESNLSEIDMKVVLGSSSIARYSLCYWMTASVDSDNPWHSFVGDEGNGLAGAETRWWWCWRKIRRIVRADIAGFQFGMRRFWVWTWRGPRIVYRSVIIGVTYSYRAIWKWWRWC